MPAVESFAATDHVLVHRLVVGPLENNVYSVECRRTGHTILIDAADQPNRLLAWKGYRPPSIVLTTHGHSDHVGAIPELVEAGCRFAMHPHDAFLVDHPIDLPLADGMAIPVGRTSIEVIQTPGHTPGSCCFLVDGVLFSGDTLFPGGPGATRFPYSDFDQIMASIEARLFSLPAETVFYPGHGSPSTVAKEQPALDDWRARGW